MAASEGGKLALLWRGDREARKAATPDNNRFSLLFKHLAALGVHAEPAVYADDMVEEVRTQLLGLDGVLVWVDPISEGRNRVTLDAMLRDVAGRGVWVSAHPDVILKMGVKEVLHATKHLGWGTDTHLYRTVRAFDDEFPRRLRTAGPRVLKQNRGNGGQGVWKVEIVADPAPDATVRVLQARRGSVPEDLPLATFMKQCEAYFAAEGCIVDQPFQPRLPDGMIRCYMAGNKVVGFGHQLIKALIPPPPEGPDSPAAQPGPRIMHPASAPEFQALRAKDGGRMDPSNGATPEHRDGLPADHLGRRFPLWATQRSWRRQLCVVRNQCQLSGPVSRPGLRGDCARRHGPAHIVATNPSGNKRLTMLGVSCAASDDGKPDQKTIQGAAGALGVVEAFVEKDWHVTGSIRFGYGADESGKTNGI